MENTGFQRTEAKAIQENTSGNSVRPRQVTTLKLQWLAERIRKVEAIKKAVQDGTYHVDSKTVALAVLGLLPEKDI